MSDVFALQGTGNCGKSTTLASLYSTLLTKYPKATSEDIHNRTADIAIIMRGVNGFVVGIESQGDPGSRLQRTLNAFVTANCDIIFCACRTRGMTVDWVNALSPQYNIHFVQQNYVTNNYANANASTTASLMQQAGI